MVTLSPEGAVVRQAASPRLGTLAQNPPAKRPRREESRAQAGGFGGGRHIQPHGRVVDRGLTCPVVEPVALQPGSEGVAKAGVLLLTTHMARLTGPQASEKRWTLSSSPASALPLLPERGPDRLQAPLTQQPWAPKGPNPGMAKGGDPEVSPLSPPHPTVWGSSAALPTSRASSFPPGPAPKPCPPCPPLPASNTAVPPRSRSRRASERVPASPRRLSPSSQPLRTVARLPRSIAPPAAASRRFPLGRVPLASSCSPLKLQR